MKLTESQYNILIKWIKKNLLPRETFNDIKTSYGLKHLFEFSEDGFYVDNDTFKQAMLECGFKVRNPSKENWIFNISQKSPALENL